MWPGFRSMALDNYHGNSQGATQGWLQVGDILQVAGSLDSCVFGLFHGLAKIIEQPH